MTGSGSISVNSDTSVCKGGKAQLRANGGINYVWSPATGLSDPTLSNPIASPLSNTRYYVTANVPGGCRAKDSVLISLLPSPTVVTSPDLSVCLGGSATISATGASKYVWIPSAGLADPTLSIQNVSPSQTTQYTVEGRDNNGCSDTGFVKVVVAKEARIYIPNAFTPNGDGINDCFRIPNAEGSTRFELAIFNRFGERVFYSRDPLSCWDGRYNGKEQGAAAFAYYLKMQNGCGDVFKKGTLVLVK